MLTQSIRVDYIETGERHRALSQDAIERLAKSMAEMGLHHPISIRFVDDYQTADGDTCDGVPLLVAGAHRLAAAKSLGWEKIDCIEVDDDPVKAEMWEIAENLHRAELTVLERSEHIAEWVRLTDGQPKAQVAPSLHTGGRSDKGINAAVRELGIGRTEAQRAPTRRPTLR